MSAAPNLLPPLAPQGPQLIASTPAVRPAAEGEEAAESAGGLSPAKLLHGLRRRWPVAVPLAVLAAAAVGGVMFSRMEPVYTARTLLHVRADRPTLLYDDQS